MAKYIDLDKAIELFYPIDPKNDGSYGCTIICKAGTYESCEIEAMLHGLPAVDVAPVVHGRWLHSGYEEYSGHLALVKCSRCSHEAYAIACYVREGNYCPYCGARMDGGAGDEP